MGQMTVGRCCVSWATLAGERPLQLGCQVRACGVAGGMLVLPEDLLGAEHSSPLVPTLGLCRGTRQLCPDFGAGGTQAEEQGHGIAL